MSKRFCLRPFLCCPTRWALLSFRPLGPDQATGHGVAEHLYHPPGDAGHTTTDGIKLLRRVALDIPVYLVRLEAGYIQRTLGQVSADLISEGRLVAGVTGYAAAFQQGEQRVLILVSRSPLRRPLPEPLVWRQREEGYPEPPPPAPLPRKRRSKGNPEALKARKKAHRKACQERREDE